jgi:hypothetical protein
MLCTPDCTVTHLSHASPPFSTLRLHRPIHGGSTCFPRGVVYQSKHMSVGLPLVWILMLLFPQYSSSISIIEAYMKCISAHSPSANHAIPFRFYTTLLSRDLWAKQLQYEVYPMLCWRLHHKNTQKEPKLTFPKCCNSTRVTSCKLPFKSVLATVELETRLQK